MCLDNLGLEEGIPVDIPVEEDNFAAEDNLVEDTLAGVGKFAGEDTLAGMGHFVEEDTPVGVGTIEMLEKRHNLD
ncbi:hypothetical protein L0F63_001743 [Massospora cicadina]|nr:hypothetical protein L0F63_001743 [Massospora cicadina]